MNLLLSEATEFVKAKTPGLNFLFQSFSAIIFMKKASTFLLKLYITSFCVFLANFSGFRIRAYEFI